MANTGNKRRRYAAALLYLAQQNSVWQQMASDAIGLDFDDALDVLYGDLADNIKARTLADTDALLTGPTDFSAATMSAFTISQAPVQVYGRLPRALTRFSGGGNDAASQWEQRLAAKVAAELDSKFAGVVAGLTYQALSVANGNMNKLSVGTAGSAYLPAGVLPKATGTDAGDLPAAFASAVLDAIQLLVDKGVVDGTTIGSDGPAGPVTFIAPTALTRLLVDNARSESALQYVDDIGGRAAVEGTIAGTTAFEGRWSGCNIVRSNATGVATSAAPWRGYVLPSGGVFKGLAYNAWVQRVLAENRTDAVADDTVLTHMWGAGVPRPEHVIQIELTQAASVEAAEKAAAEASEA